MEPETKTIPTMSKSLLWAIEPAHLDAAMQAFAVIMDGDNVDRESYMTVDQDGVATIEIGGPTARRLDWYDKRIMGMTDTDIIRQDLQEAASNPRIKAVMLYIDSPGGIVDGTQGVAAAIKAIDKPTIAYTDGLMASAAYWIGSAADQIVAAETAHVGSVGVVATHVDLSERDKKYGIKRTNIFNGKFKRMAADTEPLSDEGREYIQQMVDSIYDVFASDVARNRGASIETIKGHESRVFIASQARQAGLIDEVGSMEVAIKKLKRRIGIMDMTELKKDFPQLYQEAFEAGKVSVDVDKAKRDGAEAERTRIADIRADAFPGQDALVDELIKSGADANEARKRLIADQKGRMAQGLAEMAASDPGDIGSNADSTTPPEAPKAKNKAEAGDKLDEIARKISSEKSVKYSQGFSEACAKHPELFKVYQGK